MTPAQVDLSCRLVALPGWAEAQATSLQTPGWKWGGDGSTYIMVLQGPLAGLRFVPAPRWIPDLTDAATGGVLAGILSRLTTTSIHTWPERYAVHVTYWVGDWPHATTRGATLAEACARALVALGRCA